MSFIKCDDCGSEYYLKHIKLPSRDVGDSVECHVCGKTLHKWGKGTDHKIPLSKGGSNNIDNVQPLCQSCNVKMELKHGSYGWFWGCTRYPKCSRTMNIRESDRDLLY